MNVVRAGEGTDVGLGIVRKLVSSASGGQLCVFEAIVPPGMCVPPHVHSREDEITRVIEGALHVVVDDELAVTEAGAWVVKPRGLVHAFWNAGSVPARVIELVTPGTLDDYFAELGRLATDRSLTAAEQRTAIDNHHRRHGIVFDEARIADYRRRFGAPM